MLQLVGPYDAAFSAAGHGIRQLVANIMLGVLPCLEDDAGCLFLPLATWQVHDYWLPKAPNEKAAVRQFKVCQLLGSLGKTSALSCRFHAWFLVQQLAHTFVHMLHTCCASEIVLCTRGPGTLMCQRCLSGLCNPLDPCCICRDGFSFAGLTAGIWTTSASRMCTLQLLPHLQRCHPMMNLPCPGLQRLQQSCWISKAF